MFKIGLMIKEYKFGSIVINNKVYNYDIEARWNNEVLRWFRKESHIINIEDVKRAVEQKPDVIIIGTGESGIAKVMENAKSEIKSKGIELFIDITGKAIEIFNNLTESEKQGQKKIIGLFHLTC